MSSEIRNGDVGTEFVITIKDEDGNVKDVSSAGTLQIIFQKPDGTILTKDASLKNDGTDGKITYTTTSGDIDISGLWRIQSYVVTSNNKKKTDIASFRVHPNLE